MRIHIYISGKVTGVFFRAFVKERADELRINGWVKNVGSGIEAVFVGSKSSINKIIEYCKTGPTNANVERVKVIEEKTDEKFDGFRVD